MHEFVIETERLILIPGLLTRSRKSNLKRIKNIPCHSIGDVLVKKSFSCLSK